MTSEDAAIRRQSWAAKGAVCHDDSGKPIVYIEDAPWGTSALFVCNADPNLPLIGPDKINQAYCSYSPAVAKERYESGVVPEQDGEYIDSVEGFAWPRVCNYREEHFAGAEAPLTFGTPTRHVCILNAFSHYAFLHYTGTDLHKRGKLMFGNALPETFYFFVPSFDILGTEHDWINRDGGWQPETENRSNYRRALCYRKPYLMLLNTDFNKMSYANVEKYMRRCAFFGFFPSMFSADAFHDRYFDDPKYYDRDRPLFREVPPSHSRHVPGWLVPDHPCTVPGDRNPAGALWDRLDGIPQRPEYRQGTDPPHRGQRRQSCHGSGRRHHRGKRVVLRTDDTLLRRDCFLDLAPDDIAVLRLQRK